MNEQSVHNSIGMTRGSVLRVEDGCGLLIRVWHGGIWLTEEGDRRDHLLTTGQSLRLERDGAALASALRRSIVTLVGPEPLARRILLVRAGCKVPVALYDAATAPLSTGKRLGYVLRRVLPGVSAPHARPTTASL